MMGAPFSGASTSSSHPWMRISPAFSSSQIISLSLSLICKLLPSLQLLVKDTISFFLQQDANITG